MYEYQIVVRKISEVGMIERVKNLESELTEKAVRAQFVKSHPEYDTSEYTIEISYFEIDGILY